MATELPQDITAIVQSALAEDIGSGDITAELISAEKLATARLISREAAIFVWYPLGRRGVLSTGQRRDSSMASSGRV